MICHFSQAIPSPTSQPRTKRTFLYPHPYSVIQQVIRCLLNEPIRMTRELLPSVSIALSPLPIIHQELGRGFEVPCDGDSGVGCRCDVAKRNRVLLDLLVRRVDVLVWLVAPLGGFGIPRRPSIGRFICCGRGWSVRRLGSNWGCGCWRCIVGGCPVIGGWFLSGN
jgi:hypothetical protein